MKTFPTDLRWAAMGSSLLVLPFLALQIANTTLTRRHVADAIVLFGFLWILPLLFITIAVSTARRLRSGEEFKPETLLRRWGIAIVLALLWASVLTDQMPCFLGVPNCD